MAELLEALKGCEGGGAWNGLEDGLMQKLTATLIKIYVSKLRDGKEIPPVAAAELSSTEAAVFVDRLLKQMDIELFEMQIWRNLGSSV